jgi:hypothetical protein
VAEGRWPRRRWGIAARKRSSMRRVALFALLAFLGAGCAASDPTPVAEPKQCRAGAGEPITERALRDAFRREGIELLRDDRCWSDVLVSLSNVADAVPYPEQDGIGERQGILFCDLLRSNIVGSRIERFVWRNDPMPTYLRVLNVDCAIYPNAPEHTNRVERALRRLPGVSPDATGLPSSDAIHD